jgi:hypothetical protein
MGRYIFGIGILTMLIASCCTTITVAVCVALFGFALVIIGSVLECGSGKIKSRIIRWNGRTRRKEKYI